MNRHAYRILIVRTLYEIDIRQINTLNNELLYELISFAYNPTTEVPSFEKDDKDYIKVRDVVLELYKSFEKINCIISNNLDNYTIDRLNYVDRAIIRLAVYEMLFTDLAKSIIINEALEITKEYSTLDDGLQAKFNNRLLDKIAQGIKNE